MYCFPLLSWLECTLVPPRMLRAFTISLGHSRLAPDSTHGSLVACSSTPLKFLFMKAVLGSEHSLRTSRSRSRCPGTTAPHFAQVGSFSPHTGMTSVTHCQMRFSSCLKTPNGCYFTTMKMRFTSATETLNNRFNPSGGSGGLTNQRFLAAAGLTLGKAIRTTGETGGGCPEGSAFSIRHTLMNHPRYGRNPRSRSS